MSAMSDIAAGKWTEVLAVVTIGGRVEASAYTPVEVRLTNNGSDLSLQTDRPLSLAVTRSGFDPRVRFITGDFEFICEQFIDGHVAFGNTITLIPK